ncbi:hypothetical protein D0Z07_6157 [Hyphodiscus hymeniophilus]|uniref:Uncharacterized protein n=1 Tax=Hyphodiscus hymeniophilus TaxID=353542 RepID=A0A9P6VFC3_9HELO|nr:hypothetical protein D0Z07_6157 [Hyphodiscus hymeniophilus]
MGLVSQISRTSGRVSHHGRSRPSLKKEGCVRPILLNGERQEFPAYHRPDCEQDDGWGTHRDQQGCGSFCK